MIATLEETQNLRRASSGTVVASLEAVSKNYEDVRALRNVDFTVRAGQVVALLGPNGAGKTTAVKLLLGLIQPNSGKARVFGGNPTNPQNRMRTGAMLQVGKVPETLRVREHIDLFSSYYPQPMPLAEVLAAAGLEKLRDRKFGDLSGGQRQRTLFALAICGNPDLLFLDEPTVGLDVEARRALWEEIRRLVDRGKTVLLTTHYSGGGRRSRRPHRRHQPGRDYRRRHAGGDQVADQRQAHPLHHRAQPGQFAANSRRHRRQARSRGGRDPCPRSRAGRPRIAGARPIALGA